MHASGESVVIDGGQTLNFDFETDLHCTKSHASGVTVTPQGSVSARKPFSHASGSHWHRKKKKKMAIGESIWFKKCMEMLLLRVENLYKKVPFVGVGHPLGRFAPSHSRIAENLTPSRYLTLASLLKPCARELRIRSRSDEWGPGARLRPLLSLRAPGGDQYHKCL